jgi:hypothetical protein
MQASARCLFLPLLLAAGCDLDSDAIGESAEGLYGNLDFSWTGNPVFIPVCWENPSSGSINAPTFSVSEATTREWVRDAIEGQWSRYGRVNFTQWDTCTSGEPGIHIQILKTGVSSAPGGSTLNGVNNGVKLNQYYNDRQDCQASQANLQRCVQAVGLHEFGHVLGFYHEEERPDYPGGTGPCAKQTFPNANPQFYGAYDINSVMSYCGQPANDISTWKTAISPGDIAAVQKAYGRRKPGQFAAARGADMLANNNAIDNKAFIWDADEAAGQLWSYDFAAQVFRVTANGSTACLDTFPSATAGQQLTANQCFLDSFQRFPLDNLFLRGFGGLCLDLPGGNTTNGTPLQVWQCGALGGNNQRWSIDTSRRIHFGATNKCVTAVTTSGAALFLWDCGAAPHANNQAFTFAADGSLKMASSPASCADVQGPTTAQYLAGQGVPGNGAPVQTFTCVADQLNQKWNLSGTFKHEAGLCIDVASASNNNGTPVQTFTCNGTIAQDWDYYWK